LFSSQQLKNYENINIIVDPLPVDRLKNSKGILFS